jgi:hypothetical protein
VRRFALLALVACSPTPVTARVAPKEDGAAAVAAVLAAGACARIDGALFALPSDGGEVLDMYVLPKRCSATAERDELHVVADAYAWLAVDRELGAIRVQEFVHTTVHADVRLRTRARFPGDHLELELAPLPGLVVRVEPVGSLQLGAMNWASLLALELVPSTGTSPQRLAKQKLREEAERTLRDALSRPLVVSYDGESGATWFAKTRPAEQQDGVPPSTRVRIVPRGTSLIGPFPPSTSGATANLRVEPGHRTSVRAVCYSHAERLLDADRRGDVVPADDGWTSIEGASSQALPPMPCRWVFALRGPADATAIVDIDLRPSIERTPPGSQRDRWVSLDTVTLDLDESTVTETEEIVIGTDVWRHALHPRRAPGLPAIVELSPGQAIVVRALRSRDGTATTLGELRLPLDKIGDVRVSLPLATKDGRRIATVQLQARVREALPPPVVLP